MSIVTRIRCDTCNKERDWDEDGLPYYPPVSWFYVVTPLSSAHACSWECLETWTNRKRPIDTSKLPVSPTPHMEPVAGAWVKS